MVTASMSDLQAGPAIDLRCSDIELFGLVVAYERDPHPLKRRRLLPSVVHYSTDSTSVCNPAPDPACQDPGTFLAGEFPTTGR